MIRHADPQRDAAACAAIYAPHVLEAVTSFEAQAPDAAQMAARIAANVERHPWLVAEANNGAVVGFAYACEHRTRAAYRWAVDVSVYVAAAHRGGGVGRALYQQLFTVLEGRGYRVACAGITLPNPASVRLHESMGFEPVGVYRRIGFKHGAWHDVGWWQRALGDNRGGEPPEPASA